MSPDAFKAIVKKLGSETYAKPVPQTDADKKIY